MTESDDRDPLDELAEEFLARSRRGERPTVSEYAARHPDRAGEIRDLLSALLMVEGAKSDSDATPGPPGGSSRRDEPPLERLGDYRIIREVGRGGMGLVYEAEQESLGRCVALKVLAKRSLAAAEQVRRFHREARAAARLHHTNIVPVFGVGEHDGLHYYVMQFIGGPGLDKVLDEMRRLEGRTGSDTEGDDAQTRVGRFDPSAAEIARSLLGEQLPPPAERAGRSAINAQASTGAVTKGPLGPSGDSARRYARTVARIGLQAADALEYAHQQGVLHRDVKPSNLLLDAQGTVWVTDFGLAKATEDDDLTRTGDLIGTLRYMAPERFDGRCDARSDVYALGLTLYEMLAGHPAFGAADREHLIRQVTQTDPPRLRDLRRAVPRDLETIVHKAIERDPGDRYATAGDLARDLERFLADRPIQARRASVAERTARWARRNPAPAALATAVAVLLTAIAVGSTIAAVYLSRKHSEAVAAGLEARRTLWESYLAQARAHRRGGEAGRRAAALESVTAASRLGVHPDRLWQLRDEAIACLALTDLRQRDLSDLPLTDSGKIGFDADLARCAYQEADGRIAIRRVVGDGQVTRLPAPPVRPVSFRFSPGGRRLAAKCEENGRAGLAMWDLERREVVLASPEPVEAHALDFSPDGRWLAAGRRDGSIDLYDAAAAELTRRLPVGAVPDALAFAPGGDRLAVSSLSKEAAVQVRGLDGGIAHSFALPVAPYALAWHPDGRQLAAGGDDGRIFLLNLDSPETEPEVFERHQGAAVSLAFHPDGDLLASASWDGTLRLWNVGTGEPLVRAPCPQAGRLRFSRDGRLLGPGHDGQRHWLWHVDAGRECRTIADRDGPVDATWGIEFRPEQGLLVTTGGAGVRFDAPGAGRTAAALDLPGTSSSAFTHDGSALLTGGEAGLLRWPVRTGPGGGLRVGPPEPFGLTPGLPTGRLCLAPDGRTLAVALDWDRGRGLILDLRQPDKRLEITGHPGLERLAFSPDSRWLATGTWHGTGVKVWDARAGRLEADLEVDGSAEVLFSPDGRRLATGSGDEYRVWEVGTWRKASGIGRVNTGGLPGKMAFSPDGGTLALVRSRSVVQLTDPDTLEVLTTLVPPDLRNVASLRFSPDGARLAVTHNSHVVTLWDLHTVRTQLSTMGLDLARPLSPPADTAREAAPSIAIEPPAWLNLVRAGETHAAAGKWEEAAAAYSAAFTAGDRSPRNWSRHALLLLATGRAEEYRKACNEMLAHFGGPLPPTVEDTVAWACVIGPDATADPARVARLAEIAVAGPRDHPALNTLGAALYRAGRFEEALATLQRALAAHASGGTPHDWLFLAMTCQRLGRGEDARAWLERFDRDRATRGRSGTGGGWPEQLELRLLRDEAGITLETGPPPDN